MGWAAIMNQLDNCCWIENVGGVPWNAMQGGRLKILNLHEQNGNLERIDPGLAVVCLEYLRRSAPWLTSLDLRFFKILNISVLPFLYMLFLLQQVSFLNS